MMIYSEIDNRLDEVVTFDERSSPARHLVVVHPNDPDEWAEHELSQRLTDQDCRGLLLVKGVPRAGLNKEKFAELKRKYGDRFHASACAVGTASELTALSGELKTRFRTFFKHVRDSQDKVNWKLLDPPWPATMLSGYLLAKVWATSGEAGLDLNQEPGFTTIWENARREYELLTGNSLAHSKLSHDTARVLAKQIREYLQVI